MYENFLKFHNHIDTMDDDYIVFHESTKTIVFPYILHKKYLCSFVDILQIPSSLFIIDIMQSYTSKENIWKAFVVDVKRLQFYIDNLKIDSIHFIIEYLYKHIESSTRHVIAALCTQSTFGYIFEKLQEKASEKDTFIGELEVSKPMQIYLNIDNDICNLKLCKSLRVFELIPNGDTNTLDIIHIQIEIKVNKKFDSLFHNSKTINITLSYN